MNFILYVNVSDMLIVCYTLNMISPPILMYKLFF